MVTDTTTKGLKSVDEQVETLEEMMVKVNESNRGIQIDKICIFFINIPYDINTS